MAEETPELKRDSTMVATAKEGEAFLETQGKVHEDAKTRAQQKDKDDDNEVDGAAEVESDSPSKLARTTTMQATAKEGGEILGDEELGKTRGETENLKEKNGAEEEGENGTTAEEEDEKPSVKREGTMAVTAAEGAELLAGHDTEAGTRAEAKAVKEALEESVEKNGQDNEENDDEKPDLKRKSTMAATIEEGEDFIKRKKESNGAEQEATEVTA